MISTETYIFHFVLIVVLISILATLDGVRCAIRDVNTTLDDYCRDLKRG